MLDSRRADRPRRSEGSSLFGDAKAQSTITTLCTDTEAPSCQRAAIIAFASLDLTAAATTAAEFLADAKPEPTNCSIFTPRSSPARRGARVSPRRSPARSSTADVAKLGLQAVEPRRHRMPGTRRAH